jgi:CelD/BcsL family acetyltransferase involved in cellulose biosynthesis
MGTSGNSVELRQVDPVRDQRWPELVARSNGSSVFHSREWLVALQRTYGYEPVVFTASPDGAPLGEGLLFCRVNSWMTGKRLVSLPFSDHCEPLVDDPTVLAPMLESLKRLVGREGRYIELRPVQAAAFPTCFQVSASFCLHAVDLRPDLDDIFSRFHKSHTRRAVRKAERVGVAIEAERSAAALEGFYALHTMTRRRHDMPVQPFEWFQNLQESFKERMSVYVARLDDRPVAAILTLVHKRTLVYKYGCSDARYNSSGATSALFWRAIRDAKAADLRELDLGRSDLEDEGLQAFKDHLGGTRRTLDYYRYPGRSASGWRQRLTPTVMHTAQAFVPRAIKTRAGSSFYKHFA